MSFFMVLGVLIICIFGYSNTIFASEAQLKNEQETENIYTKDVKELENFVKDFILNVFSDFSDLENYSVKNVAPNSDKLLKYLSDKKKVIQLQEEIFNLSYRLKSSEFNFIKIQPLKDGKWEVLVRVFYQYDDIRDGVPVGSGASFNYKLILQEEEGSYLVMAAISDDLASGNLMGDFVVENYNLFADMKMEDKLGEKTNLFPSYKKNVLEIHQYNDLDTVKKSLIEAKENIESEAVDEKIGETLNGNSEMVPLRRGPLRALNKSSMKTYMDNNYFLKGKYHDPANGNYDCTNYASNVLRAGGASIDREGSLKWFPDNTTWIRVNELRPYLINNTSTGPVGVRYSTFGSLETGDLIQLKQKGQDRYKHTVVVYNKGGNPYVTAHSNSYSGYFNPKYTNVYNEFYKIHIKGTY